MKNSQDQADSEVEDDRDDKYKDDAIQQSIGSYGKFQLLLVLFYLPCKIPTALHPLGIVFLAPPVKYVCLDNTNSTVEGSWNQCPCENPSYDNSLFEDTIITYWDLICEKEWLVSFNQTIHMLGILIGSIIFGMLSDRFGRKYTLLAAVGLELVSGIASSFIPVLWVYIVLRFFIGASVGGTLIISFVLLMEFTGKKYRELATSMTQLPFNTGYILLPIIGYYSRQWQDLQFLFSISPILMIGFFWFLPESPRWLLTAGRDEEAAAVIKRAADINKLPTDNIKENIRLYQEQKSYETVAKGNVIDLFRTPNIRKNTICMAINWIVCSFGFYGVSQYIGQLSGDMFINVAISAVLNCIATVVIYFMTKYMKRKSSLLLLNIGSAICLFLIAAIPDEGAGAMVKVVLACIGNLGMFVAFIVVYLYASELFPTVVRNVAMGICSMLARVGSMVAPFIVTLKSTAVWLPPVIFGAAPLLAAALCLLMPETKGCDLMNTLTEGENFTNKKTDENEKEAEKIIG